MASIPTGQHLSYGNRFFVSLTVFFIIVFLFSFKSCEFVPLAQSPRAISAVLASSFSGISAYVSMGLSSDPAGSSHGTNRPHQFFVVPRQLSDLFHDFYSPQDSAPHESATPAASRAVRLLIFLVT